MSAPDVDALNEARKISDETDPGGPGLTRQLEAAIRNAHDSGYSRGLAAGAEAALQDALTLAENRRDTFKALGYAPAAVAGCDEVAVFIRAELERARDGSRIPGSPGAKTQVAASSPAAPKPSTTEAAAHPWWTCAKHAWRSLTVLGKCPSCESEREQPQPAPAEKCDHLWSVPGEGHRPACTKCFVYQPQTVDASASAPATAAGLSEEQIAAMEHTSKNIGRGTKHEGLATQALWVTLLAAECRRLRSENWMANAALSLARNDGVAARAEVERLRRAVSTRSPK